MVRKTPLEDGDMWLLWEIENLHGNSRDDDTSEHGHGLEERANRDELELDYVQWRQLCQVWEVVLDCPLLEQGLSLDLQELELDEVVVDIEIPQFGERSACVLFVAVVDEPPGCEWHENHTNDEDEGWGKLQCKRNKPCPIGLVLPCTTDIVAAIVDPERDQNAELNSELLQSDQKTPQFWGSTFGDVHGNDHGEGANTHSDHEPTTQDRAVAGRGDSRALDNDAEDENSGVNDDGIFPTDELCKETRVKSACPSSEFEDGGQPSFLGLILGVYSHVSIEASHGEHTGEHALVVAIEQTTDTGEGRNKEDANILDECCRTSRGSCKSETPLQGGIVELRY